MLSVQHARHSVMVALDQSRPRTGKPPRTVGVFASVSPRHPSFHPIEGQSMSRVQEYTRCGTASASSLISCTTSPHPPGRASSPKPCSLHCTFGIPVPDPTSVKSWAGPRDLTSRPCRERNGNASWGHGRPSYPCSQHNGSKGFLRNATPFPGHMFYQANKLCAFIIPLQRIG